MFSCFQLIPLPILHHISPCALSDGGPRKMCSPAAHRLLWVSHSSCVSAMPCVFCTASLVVLAHHCTVFHPSLSAAALSSSPLHSCLRICANEINGAIDRASVSCGESRICCSLCLVFFVLVTRVTIFPWCWLQRSFIGYVFLRITFFALHSCIFSSSCSVPASHIAPTLSDAFLQSRHSLVAPAANLHSKLIWLR